LTRTRGIPQSISKKRRKTTAEGRNQSKNSKTRKQ